MPGRPEAAGSIASRFQEFFQRLEQPWIIIDNRDDRFCLVHR
jgi:hypothetical protein